MDPKARLARRLYREAVERRVSQGSPARLQIHPEPYVTGQYDCRAHEFRPVGRGIVREICAGPQHQRVGQPDQTGGAAQFGDQHAGVRLIALPRFDQVFGRNREFAAIGVIEEPAK